jgi:hypothetical protein
VILKVKLYYVGYVIVIHNDTRSTKRQIGVFVGFSRIFLLGILICKGLTARRLYKSFGVKGLKKK